MFSLFVFKYKLVWVCDLCVMVDDTREADINSILMSFVEKMKNMVIGSDGKPLKPRRMFDLS